MTPAVIWMRHGTCDDGLCRPDAHARPASPLTIAGAVETLTTARVLAEKARKPALIVTSPLRRAQQSGAIVADALGVRQLPPIPAFTEWRAPTCVLGLGPDEYPANYRVWRTERGSAPDSALPGGDNLRAFAERAAVAAALAHGLAEDNGRLLVVTPPAPHRRRRRCPPPAKDTR